MESVLNVVVSCFENYMPDKEVVNNPKPVNLLMWLKSDKYADRVKKIRDLGDKKERDAIKATLPAITPSGIFSRRASSALVQHSGLVCLDIDLKGNETISNYDDLKQELCKLTCVAYCGLSVSGRGFFVLIPIVHPMQHERQFRALQILFATRCRVAIDKACKDVARLRGYSYDPDAYFNHQAVAFRGLYQEASTKAKKRPLTSQWVTNEETLLPRLVHFVERATDGNRHDSLLKAATVAGGYVAAGRMDEQTAIYALETVASEWPDFPKSQGTIRDGLRYGLAKPIYADNKFIPFTNRYGLALCVP
jgi:hypothetical protein